MSWAGALGGLGRSVKTLTSKYIDEELAQQRAQFLQDLQLQGEKKREEYQQSPEVQNRRNENAAKSTLAQRAAERQSVVDGANDTRFQGALDTTSQLEATRKGQATATQIGIETPAKVASANQVEAGTRDERLATKKGELDLTTRAQMRMDANRAALQAKKEGADPLAGFSIPDKERLKTIGKAQEQLRAEIVKNQAQAGGWDPANNPGQAQLEQQMRDLQIQQDMILSRYESGGIGDLAERVRNAAPAAQQQGEEKPKGLPRIKDGEKRSEPPKSHDQLFADGIKSADDRQLKRWASIKGHTHQQAAKEELERRQREWESASRDEPSGIGFGTFGGP